MSKQIHIRLDDTMYEQLTDYNTITGLTVQESITNAVTQMLAKKRQKSSRTAAGSGGIS